jgi:hypothetical protein
MAITAITSRIWMMAPTLKAKKPKSHKMIKITATIYNKLLITLMFGKKLT